MDEKINTVAKHRPTWMVFIWVVGLLVTLAAGSYVFTNGSIKDTTASIKSDMKEMKGELLEAIRDIKK